MITIQQGKKYLVTGGSGFLGFELISRLLHLGAEVVSVARNEGNLIKLKQEFPSLEIYTGDICDKFTIHQAMKDIEGYISFSSFQTRRYGRNTGERVYEIKCIWFIKCARRGC